MLDVLLPLFWSQHEMQKKTVITQNVSNLCLFLFHDVICEMNAVILLGWVLHRQSNSDIFPNYWLKSLSDWCKCQVMGNTYFIGLWNPYCLMNTLRLCKNSGITA